MINSVNNSSQVAQSHQLQQYHQSPQTHKNSQNDQEPQDTVVLSKKASEATQTHDAEHDGDNH
jgi:hypothetical protein